MTNKELENLRMHWVTALVCTTVFNEVHDELKVSFQYNGQLKKAGRQFEIQLVKNCNKLVDDLWQANEIAASDLTQAIRDIGSHLATLTPGEIMILKDLIKKQKL